ncbi:endonuclease domain-containing protein [Flavobacterium sp. XN-5]|uniref:endonuclease domain-containing protein n=1 Tax=Flavobacterium sp. XN-5 TaxID=2599390 RepID=UPI0011C960CB|nr:endonuclease domain-containing protein [Flavobacterium sp. XN-5]NGY37393.1 endonuclease domain-containing protein [Flavobacterium sp. XN-5]
MKKRDSQDDESMWKGAPASGFLKAQSFRVNSTDAEVYLWERLKSNQFQGLKFRRQHPIGIYIVDFYCHQHQLIIEIDGGYHNSLEQIEKDQERTNFLSFQGLKVVRFTNEQVLREIGDVLEKIGEWCEK